MYHMNHPKSLLGKFWKTILQIKIQEQYPDVKVLVFSLYKLLDHGVKEIKIGDLTHNTIGIECS